MRTRRIIGFLSFFLLPVTLNYFSPVLLVQSSFESTFSIIHIIYGLMLISAIFFGAAWCSHVCPFGLMQDILPGKKSKPKLMNSRFPNLKPITGIVLLLLIIAPFIVLGIKKVIIFYHMEDTKVTLDSLHGLFLYYYITGGIILVCSLIGRRVWCKYLCPMYIFNYIGMAISKLLKFPKLGISSDIQKCSHCQKCNSACLMGLKVSEMVEKGIWNTSECIQCGECISACKNCAIKRIHF